MDVKKRSVVIPVSQEMFDDAMDFRALLDRWADMSPEEHDEQVRQAVAARALERAESVRVEPTVDNLRDKFGWSEAYARHLVQPYCYCDSGSDGWEYCQHAYDEGLVP